MYIKLKLITCLVKYCCPFKKLTPFIAIIAREFRLIHKRVATYFKFNFQFQEEINYTIQLKFLFLQNSELLFQILQNMIKNPCKNLLLKVYPKFANTNQNQCWLTFRFQKNCHVQFLIFFKNARPTNLGLIKKFRK